ncbi:MAG: glycosyltransferase, partial [Bdellovibrionota bacterium]
MAESQKQLGHEIRFVTLEGSPLEEKVVKAGFQNHSVKLGALGKTAFSFELSRLLTGSDRPDILHLHSTQDINMSLPAMVLSRGMPGPRTKVILQIHIWISHSKKDPLHAIAYSLIDEVWCSSEPAKATLERYLPIAPKKLRIVRYGRKIEAISKGMLGRPEARRILNIPEDAVVLGNVARIDEGKGTRELIEA